METSIATVVFLRRDGCVCLAPKKRNIHGKGKELEESATLNGYGGKLEENETVLECACRELQVESGITCEPKNLKPAADISFFWPGNDSKIPNMRVYFFFLYIWEGEPRKGKEMGIPKFYPVDKIPYEKMMPGDQGFLPFLFKGETLVGEVRFLGENRTKVNLMKTPVILP